MKRTILVSACLLGINCKYNGTSNENDIVKELQKIENLMLIPVCPEQLGGLPTPRKPSERKGLCVINDAGEDVTAEFLRGAEEAGKLAEAYGCELAILKERSPSCGYGMIYDGTFTKKLQPGNGITAERLWKSGVQIFGESEIPALLEALRKSGQEK